MNMYESIYFLK